MIISQILQNCKLHKLYNKVIFHSMYNDDQNNPLQYMFFLFVNTGSGANVGAELLNQQVERIQFILNQQNGTHCSVFIYNMRTNRQQGFRRLKVESQNNNKCYAIVCGGDGTVMWVVTQLIQHNIKVASVPIGVIPLGTGNDFSRQLGWGYQKSGLLKEGFKNLKKQIRKWLKAKQQYFDIWDVQAQTFQDGKFEKVKGGVNEVQQGRVYKSTFCNYFSFGIDGKIGYSFDMHRTTTRLGNLAMYACLGMIKALTKTKTLDQLLSSIQVHSSKKFVQKKKYSLNNLESSISQQTKNSIIIRSQSSKQIKEMQSTYFEKDFYNILMLNINSYTGGVSNIWENANRGFLKNFSYKEDYEQVSTCDGKLQVVSFGSSVGIALQRFCGGRAKKVAQGDGPFVFSFNRYNIPKHRTYLQIDGEFIRFTNPKSITVRQSSLVPKGKIKVLRYIPERKR